MGDASPKPPVVILECKSHTGDAKETGRDDDARIRDVVFTAYNCVYEAIWANKDLSNTEARLVWFRVVDLMVTALVVEYREQVIQERNRVLYVDADRGPAKEKEGA